MSFLLRPMHTATSDLPRVPESEAPKNVHPVTTTLEGLIAEDHYLNSSGSEDDRDSDEGNGSTSMNRIPSGEHTDVTEDEGWITIPCKELPDSWTDASSIQELQYMDRSFVFPGEQLHILVCLSASKQYTEAITPFKVAAVMSRNGASLQNGKKSSSDKLNSLNGQGITGDLNEERNGHGGEENRKEASVAASNDHHEDISATRNILQMEDHKHQTEILLEKFRKSNFFVRVAGSDEPLWSKRNEKSATSENQSENEGQTQISKNNVINAVVDRGSFDGRTSSGVARNTATCYSLCNGDIVVLLQVNVGIVKTRDSVLEVLQFEKYQRYDISSDESDHFLGSNLEDPCHELLNWLLPLDRALPPRPLSSSPPVASTSGVSIAHQRSTSSSSASQIFSFGHFRSYSMPSLPEASIPSSTTAGPSSLRPAFDIDDVQRYSPEKLRRNQDRESNKLLSFRGVSLEPQRFSVHCGLQGIYLPGRRWRRRFEIVQSLKIHSFAAECATEDLLCVQVKNISPAHLPDIIIYVDAITIIFEEASKNGQSLSLPISSIETGNSHNLPDLPLRRGEEHSFVLKPATTMGKSMKAHEGANSLALHVLKEESRPSTGADQFAVLVSCRCNYTESKLFFKKRTSWRPRVTRDLLISVASEPTEHTIGPNAIVPQLPVQVLRLQASNLTSEDLTLTVLAPVSSTSPPSVVSLTSSPKSQIGPFASFPEMGKVGTEKRVAGIRRLSSMPYANETQKEGTNSGIRSISLGQRTGTAPDIISNTNLGCTHLWLQSTVPLGCVPAHSSATVKLELLPLTDGIITLDTLQIAVKEKGITYKPEQPLKIYATSENATGIV